MASTAYPPSGPRNPPPPRPRGGSSPAIHSPAPIRTTSGGVKTAMYDLPPTLLHHSSSNSPSGGGGARGKAGGLRGVNSGVTSPPPLSLRSYNNNNSSTPPPFSPTDSIGRGGGVASPTSPTFLPLHHPRPGYFPSSPHGSPSTRSPTPGSSSVFSKAPQNPSSPSPADISLFHDACHRFFYLGDGKAQRYIDQVLASLPPSHRAAFTRVQAAVRTAYHADEEIRRRNEFEVLLRGTDPGGGLMVGNRRDPGGKSARKEREERLRLFLKGYGGKNEVGPRPFLTALYTALRLQTVGEEKGGAGARRVEWEVDDAVWMEAGGKDFMIEAIAVVKGVLGFEDVPRTKARRHRHPRPSTSIPHTSSFSSNAQSSGPNSYSIPNGMGGPSQSHRRPSELEELRPTPEDGEEGDPLYDSRRNASSPPPQTGSRRGKAPPIPTNGRQQQDHPTATQAQLRSSASSSNPLLSSRRRASSDPFSDPYANMARQPPPVPPNSVKRRGAAPPPPPLRPHPTFLALDASNNNPSPLGGGPRSTSQTSTGGPMSPQAEDFLIPGRTSAGAGMSPGSAGPLLADHQQSALADDDFSEDDYTGSDDDEDEDPLLPRWRTWVAPSNLPDPSLRRLCSLFPSHITSPAKNVRLPYTGLSITSGSLSSRRGSARTTPKELEEGTGVVSRGEEGKRVGKGVLEGVGWTGRMWKGDKLREDGWRGGWWTRLMGWFRRLLGGS